MKAREFTADELLGLINDNLIHYLKARGIYANVLTEAEKYSLSTGGKRLRPLLLLGAVQMCGGNPEEALPFACAVEYIHTYSLIHDDLPAMDNDDYRRGMLTCHKVFGEDMAVLAGDGLLTTAFELMTGEILREISSGKIKAMQCIAAGANNMVSGQTADVKQEKPDNQLIRFVHTNKTGALLSAAVTAGAYLAGAGHEMLADISVFGEYYGYAFQIADDLEDADSDEGINYARFYGSDKARSDGLYCLAMAEKAIAKYKKSDVLLKAISVVRSALIHE